MKMKKITYFIFIIAFTACATQEGGHDHGFHGDEEGQPSLVEHDSLPSDEVVFCNGRVEVPPQYRADVHARVAGYLDEVNVLKGQEVKAGETLAVLTDREVLVLQQRYLQSFSQESMLANALERKEALHANKTISDREWEESQSAHEVERRNLESLEQQLAFLGVQPSQVLQNGARASIAIKAPISGFVNSVNANRGKYVDANTLLFEVLDESHKHIELQVFPSDAKRLQLHQRVEFTIGGSGEVYSGSVFLINKGVDEHSQSINVHVHPEGLSPSLLVASFVEARIYVNEIVQDVKDSEH
jgi:cobalt-zinc-cadmium efflux system membrane fusion protein